MMPVSTQDWLSEFEVWHPVNAELLEGVSGLTPEDQTFLTTWGFPSFRRLDFLEVRIPPVLVEADGKQHVTVGLDDGGTGLLVATETGVYHSTRFIPENFVNSSVQHFFLSLGAYLHFIWSDHHPLADRIGLFTQELEKIEGKPFEVLHWWGIIVINDKMLISEELYEPEPLDEDEEEDWPLS